MAIKLNGSNTEGSPGFTGDDTDTGLQCGTNELSLVTGGTTRATVDSSGQFGIGTTSPSNSLHVVSNTPTTATAFIRNTSTGNDSPALIVRGGANNTNTVGTFEVQDFDGNADLRVQGTGALQFNSGFGSAATAFGCRAWVNFDGKSGSIGSGRASGNISSIDDNGIGQYTVNFNNSFPDNDYAVAQFCRADSGGGMRVAVGRGTTGFANGSIQIEVRNGSNNNEDVDVVCLAFFR